jgi:hypothetical protein
LKDNWFEKVCEIEQKYAPIANHCKEIETFFRSSNFKSDSALS